MTEKDIEEKFDIWRMLNDNEEYGIDYNTLPYLKKFIFSLVYQTRQKAYQEGYNDAKQGKIFVPKSKKVKPRICEHEVEPIANVIYEYVHQYSILLFAEKEKYKDFGYLVADYLNHYACTRCNKEKTK